MTSHKVLTIILIILAIFLVVSVFIQNKNTEETVTTPIITEQVDKPVVSTTTIATTTPPAATFPKEISLHTDSYFEFPDNTILSIKKINDSRCATDVNCIWAGNVIVLFNLKNKTTFTEDFDLKFGPGTEGTSYNYKGYTIKIKNIAPDKGTTNQILTQKDYKVVLQISK